MRALRSALVVALALASAGARAAAAERDIREPTVLRLRENVP